MNIVHPFARDLAADYIPPHWTPEHVEKRLADAIRVARKLPGGGPRGPRSAWPAFLAIADDDEAQDALEERWVRPTAHEISLMEEAICWPMQYVSDSERLRLALKIRCLSVAFGKPFSRLAKKHNFTCYHAKQLSARAYNQIINGLTRDNVAIR